MSDFPAYPFAYFEGKTVPIEDAKMSVMTNALHYGIGIFGGIKAVETPAGIAIFRLDDHVARLRNSVTTLGFPYIFDPEQIKKTILELAKKNKVSGTTYIRPIIYRSDTNLSPDIAGDYDIAIYMLKMDQYFDADKGISVCVSDWVRNSEDSIPPRTKATGGYINSALAINDAHKAGFDSAIMLDKRGEVSEGAVMNIFLVKNDKLITPSVSSDILEGITRKTVKELAEENNIELIERKVKPDELFEADEVFFTGTAANVTWCRQIDDKKIGEKPGPITTKFVALFQNLPKTHKELYTAI